MGPNLIEPKYSYEYRPNPRKVDKSLPFYQKVPAKLKLVSLDFADYLGDLVYNRQSEFSFKTADFCKRNWHKFSHTADHIWDEMKKVGRGFRMLKDDLKFYLRVQKSKIDYKYDKPSYKQDVKLRQVKSDFIKFIPFSLFIIIPGAELLLPAWLVVFPNSIPSQFLSDEARTLQFKKMTERRDIAAEKLLYILPKYLYALEKDPSVDEADKEQVKHLKHILRSENALPTDLLQFRQLFQKYA
jgi:hypothetical protein